MAEQQPSFADVLNQLMTQRGLSQAQLARALGTYDGNVRRWRTGGGIEMRFIGQIADYFGVDPTYLARLAGYPDNALSIAKDSGDDDAVPTNIAAMVDAERSALQEMLRGIPPIFHRTIIAAQQEARKLSKMNIDAAIELAARNEAPEISSPPPTPLTDVSKPHGKLNRGRDRGQSPPLSKPFQLATQH